MSHLSFNILLFARLSSLMPWIFRDNSLGYSLKLSITWTIRATPVNGTVCSVILFSQDPDENWSLSEQACLLCVSEEEDDEDALPCYIESVILREDLFLELRRQ